MVENHHTLCLKDRRIFKIAGDDATHFLHTLITTDVENMQAGSLMPGALLSPQGKVLFDFLIGKTANGYVIDIDKALADNFVKRLSLYKLRSQVEIIESSESLVTVSWQNDSVPSQNDSCFVDKRFPENEKVARFYGQNAPSPIDGNEDGWKLLRIKYGVAESGEDFSAGDVFPHDINYDQTGGLSFKKGCYIGQEVVSRMHHRSTARRRMMVAQGQENLEQKSTVESQGKPLGQLGTVVGNQALALVRIDRVKAAMDNAQPIMAGNVVVSIRIAENMNYQFPDSTVETK